MVWALLKRYMGSRSNETGNRLPKPKPMTQAVGKELIVALHQDPDWVWKLKIAELRRENDKNLVDMRVFDPAQAAEKKLHILNYGSLDNLAEIILFEGVYDRKNYSAQMKEKQRD